MPMIVDVMKLLLALPVVAALAACQPASKDNGPIENEASEDLVATNQTQPRAGDPSLPDIGADNCIAELARTANRDPSDIRVISVDPSAGPVEYRLQLGDAPAPWICVTNPNASVIELYYGAEG